MARSTVRSTALAALALLVLAALPVHAAASSVIRAGIDPWITVPEGTKIDFEHNPLPAGFFCAGSPAFSGRIWLRGVPLASDNSQLAEFDTIVDRLDDAAFDNRGIAQTRIQIRALQLEGIETFKNRCGAYNVQVTLDGEQPITRMRILRESKRGGRFLATVKINTKVIFTRVDDPTEKLEFSYPVAFKPSPYHHWAYRDPRKLSTAVSEAMVDTDWDGHPDTIVRGASNFGAGQGNNTAIKLSVNPVEFVDHGCHLVRPGTKW